MPLCKECSLSLSGKGFYLPDLIPGAKKVRAYASYSGTIAKVIRAIKFNNIRPLLTVLGQYIREDLGNFIEEIKPDLITYVPVHFFRWYRRGFDQNRDLLMMAGFEPKKVLKRVKHSPPLAGLGKEERSRKVAGSFRVTDAGQIRGKKVLVFDDVLTTGSTAQEVLKTLKQAGAGEVYFYFLAVEY